MKTIHYITLVCSVCAIALLCLCEASASTEAVEPSTKSTIDLARIKTEEGRQLLKKYSDRIDEYDKLSLENKRGMIRAFARQSQLLSKSGADTEESAKAEELRSLVFLLQDITPEEGYIHLRSLDEAARVIEENHPDIERMWYRRHRAVSYKSPDFMQAMREREAREQSIECAGLSDEDAIRELVLRRLLGISMINNSECTEFYVRHVDKLGEVSDAFIDRFKDCDPALRKTLRTDEYTDRDRRLLKYVTPHPLQDEEYLVHSDRGYIFDIKSVEWISPTEVILIVVSGSRRDEDVPTKFHLRKENGKWTIVSDGLLYVS